MEVKPSEVCEISGVSAPPRGALWAIAFLLLALAMVLSGGYQFGAGNQSIQIPFLKKAAEPGLYVQDVMVTNTLPSYPTWFFRGLATVLPLRYLPDIYLVLHGLSALGLVAAVFLLGRACSRDDWTGLVAVLLMIGAQHRSLTGEDLYLRAFTHTAAVFPLALLAMVLFYRDRPFAAWVLAGALFNLHALTSLHVGVLLGFGTLGTRRELGWRKSFALAALYLLAAAPTLVPLLAYPQTFDRTWIDLTRIRSAGHTFLASGWQTGNTDLPRFVLIAASAALALSFSGPVESRRRTGWLMAGAGFLFLTAWLGSEVWPVSVVLRAQLLRSSRLVMVLLLVLIAHGLVRAWRLPWDEKSAMPQWRRWLEFGSATVLGLCIAVPSLLPLLPVAFTATTLVAVINGRLSPFQAAAAGLAIVFCLAAHRFIDFPWTGWVAATMGDRGALAVVAVTTGLLVWTVAARSTCSVPRWCAGVAGLIAAVVLAVNVYYLHAATNAAADPWVDAQEWVRTHTPRNAVVITPIQPGGFRIHSERAVVGEWRDGTQLFFTADFAHEWWTRMTALQPGLITDQTGHKLLAPGRSLETLDDQTILDLANRFGATLVVLPTQRPGSLVRLYANREWSVFRPEVVAAPTGTAADTAADRERFFREAVLPNIVSNRQSKVTLQVVDTAGRPLRDAQFKVRQLRHAFHFSASLPFFIEPCGASGRDFRPPPVTAVELEKFPEIFNFSLIPYSGKWLYIEPEDGLRVYDDLDRYVAWCREHNIGMEYHFVSGYAPPWLEKKSAEEKGERFLQHARDLATRYGSQIEYWQVVNEKHLLQQSPPVFKEFRRLAPQARLGISDCANFYSTDPPENRLRNLARGLDEIRWLKTQGISLDFFGFHGHRPFGVWPDPREMYQLLDAFAKEGVRIHITEFALPLGGEILGYGPKGKWTPELQAQFYEWFFTVCFSHPAVDLINLWGFGPVNWQAGTGLLDEHYQPKPVFHALHRLINERWHTQVSGQLGLDGSATFRGFHGDYELVVAGESNQIARATFRVAPADRDRQRFRLDREAGTLTAEVRPSIGAVGSENLPSPMK